MQTALNILGFVVIIMLIAACAAPILFIMFSSNPDKAWSDKKDKKWSAGAGPTRF